VDTVTITDPSIEPTDADVHEETDASVVRTSLIELDPREIVVNVKNPRDRARRIEELKDSISQIGLLDPIVVFLNNDGRYELRDGFRRRTACIELDVPTVPCRLVEAGGDAEQIVAMLASALHRDDLTVSEEARGYEQLTLLDWEPEAIAQVVAKPVARVKQALTLTKMPEKARKAADDGTLPLDQVALLEEFKDDPDLLSKVVEKGADSTWGFKHVISDAKNRRDRKAAANKLRAELTLAGVKLIGRPKDFPWDSKAARAGDLRDADGNPLVPSEVQARAGFAAFVENDGYKPAATIVCLDPEGMGYTRTSHTNYKSPEELAEKERAAAEAAERAEALAAAAEIRKEFLKTTYHSAKSIKNLFVQALRDTVVDPDSVRARQNELLTSLAGGLIADAEKAGQDRLSRMLVAKWLVCHEARLAGGRVVRSDRAKVIAYLDRLTTDGYTLSDTENRVRTELETALAAEVAAEAAQQADAAEGDENSIAGHGDEEGSDTSDGS